MDKKPKNKWVLRIIFTLIWLSFIISMSLSVLTRIIDTPTYMLYGLVVLYILYVYLQIIK